MSGELREPSRNDIVDRKKRKRQKHEFVSSRKVEKKNKSKVKKQITAFLRSHCPYIEMPFHLSSPRSRWMYICAETKSTARPTRDAVIQIVAARGHRASELSQRYCAVPGRFGPRSHLGLADLHHRRTQQTVAARSQISCGLLQHYREESRM